MKVLVVKGFVSCGSIIGVGCAVAAPFASSGITSYSNTQISEIRGGGVSICNLGQQATSVASLVGQTVNFDKLGTHISNKLNETGGCKDLSFKAKLEDIFKTTLQPNQLEGEVEQEHGLDCSSQEVCGFLNMKATKVRKPQDFKVRFLKNSQEGQVLVIKRFQNYDSDVSYYDGHPSLSGVNHVGGHTVQNSQGSDFSFGESATGGNKINGFSIKHP